MRRWPGKPELVRAAVDAFVAGRVLSSADTGSLRGDLLAVMRAMRSHLTAEFMAMMSGLVHAMRADSELAGSLAFACHVVDDIVLPLLAGSVAQPSHVAQSSMPTTRPR